MALPIFPVWKEAPFLRILFPFLAGIICQYYFPLSLLWISLVILFSLLSLFLFSRSSPAVRFRYAWIYGAAFHVLLLGLGNWLMLTHDFSAKAAKAAEAFREKPVTIVSILDPLSDRPSSLKTTAAIHYIRKGSATLSPEIKMLLYFIKDSNSYAFQNDPDTFLLAFPRAKVSIGRYPGYGDRIAFIKPPQSIKNFDTTGYFDYVRYCALKNIYFQVYLNRQDYILLKGSERNFLSSILFFVRDRVVSIIQENIPSKKEYGFAEALLIGYRDDLQKNLLTAYSNTGVVHVVAISGLHLGLIYALLKQLCIPLRRKKSARWLTPLIVLTGLWMFSLLAGGGPSILRSAVMFSFIVLGENIQRHASLINNLAASAFLLLCYQPLWFWDIGFQLSYTALLSIALFMKPIYHLLVFKNKLADHLWKLNAVTIAAQLLTLPLSVYYFHQLPTLFLITNFIAVPLSGAVLMGEIALCVCSFSAVISRPMGQVICRMIKILNGAVEWVDGFSYSTLTGIHINLMQLIFLYIFLFSTAAWLILRQNKYVFPALIAMILFMAENFI